jgi:transcription-repair coupling factor (superfamily II helicase)
MAKREPALGEPTMPPEGTPALAAEPLGLLAVRLVAAARDAGGRGFLHVAGSERRAEALGLLASRLDPDLLVVPFPPWDCLPYERASPSREVMGRRMAALRRLAGREGKPCLVLSTPDALLQRVPPRQGLAEGGLKLAVGDAVDPEALREGLRRAGYELDDRVDEAGECAVRGQVIDVFPAGAAQPFRLEHEDGRITVIRAYDPVSQRTEEEVERLRLDPATELPPEALDGEADEGGREYALPAFYPSLDTLFDHLPEARLLVEPKAEGRAEAAFEQLADAYGSRTTLRRGAEEGASPVLPPDRLYLGREEWAELIRARKAAEIAPATDGGAQVPRFALHADPPRALGAFLKGVGERRIVLAAATDRDARALARAAEKGLHRRPEPAGSWPAALGRPAGSLVALRLDLDVGFVDAASGTVVVAAADLLGSRAGADAPGTAPGALPVADTELRLGDAVVHLDHGLCVLRGLDAVEGAGEQARLEFAGEAKLLEPVGNLDRVWRYGSDPDAVSLDRLEGEAWPKRRAALETEIRESAEGLVRLAKERDAAEAPKLVPPPRAFERFVSRFPFPETADQARAIADTLADLVCGDVGFGKTEVALRAAAAAALAGKQVAIVAPTTVLVRQHLRSVKRRFARLGVEVGHLSRLVKPAQAKALKEGLASGAVRVVVGTHALTGKGVRFKDLGLVVIDEEQRFGAAQKAKLRGLAKNAHALTLTATPIPRTLLAVQVGLQDVSVIAAPPARRRPIRTFLSPLDPVTVREALVRERRRGGQSFVVCPRIEDIEGMGERLGELVPELKVVSAHGGMAAEAIDEAMIGFADGDGDVLLATNIIESGLDVPRANTMLVWRADRFGLAQLHQLRGRVGRGRAQGVCYLLTDPTATVAPATRKRLETLAALDRLGAGFEVSARDLDGRGAGDLLGETQAGHVNLIGAGLYQHLLARALRAARGEPVPDETRPELNLDLPALIPPDYVPEPEVRLNLYARVAKLDGEADLGALTDEIDDRFGPLPPEVEGLLQRARIVRLCRTLGVARLDAGPKAIALTPRRDRADALRRASEGVDGLEWKGERVLDLRATESAEQRAGAVLDLLGRLAARR